MIMAIDPGGKSGIAIRMPNGSIQTAICESLFDKQTKVRYDPEELYEMICLPGITIIVMETFQAQTIERYGLHTVRLTGGIEALCWKLNIKLIKHMPQDRYPFREEAKAILRKIGKPFMVHESDALAHLLRYEHDSKATS